MKTITITSGKGGVGKTTVGVNLAIALAQAGKRVVLFDADLQLANVDVAMGLRPEYNLQHVVAGQKSLREVLTSGPAGVLVASGGSAVASLMTAGPKRLGLFIAQLAELERDTDFLLFDTGAGLDNRVITFAKLGEDVLLVTTPDPTSVTDAYATAKTIYRKDPEACIRVLVNQAADVREADAIYSTLSEITEQFLARRPGFAGCVRSDPAAQAAIRKRIPFMISAPQCGAALDMRLLAEKLMADRVAAASAAA